MYSVTLFLRGSQVLLDHARHESQNSPIRSLWHRPTLHRCLILHSGINSDSEKALVEIRLSALLRGSAIAMQGFKRPGAGMGLMVVLVAMVMASAYGEQPCSVKELMPCLPTAKGPYPPQPDHSCCTAVMEANPTCLCSEYVNNNLPQSFIKNILAMPKACGRSQLSGFHCGIYTIE